MSKQIEVEQELLRLHAAKLLSDGYSIIFEPSATELPEEIKTFRPDAIAIGKKPHLVLEVAREGKSVERTKEIARALSANPDWKLYAIFDNSQSSKLVAVSSLFDIRKFVSEISEIEKKDARAALLVCWASLEALARNINPENFSRPQTPGRVIEQLASMGYIVSSEADFLRGLSQKRNLFIHGDLSVSVSEKEIRDFSELFDSLIGAAERQEHRS